MIILIVGVIILFIIIAGNEDDSSPTHGQRRTDRFNRRSTDKHSEN
jgi:hypothetical protein